MTAPAVQPSALGSVCPCCRLTILNPFTIATWRGQDVCCFCRDDLTSTDAEDARKRLTMEPRDA